MGAGRFSSFSALLSSGRAPDDLSLFFSDEELKSTPPKPTLGAGATGAVAAVEDESKPPKVRPPPRVDCPRPVEPELENSEEPRLSPVAGAEEATPPPRLRENPVDDPL